MPVFGRRVDVPGGRRRDTRDPVLLPASASTLQDYRPVMIENVCASGAKLSGRNLPPEGAEILVKTDRLQLLARVAWALQDRCGISFDAPLDEEEARCLRNEGHWANLMDNSEAAERNSDRHAYRLTF